MKIAIGTIGSHGDVRPHVAFAKEIQKRGHEVVLSSSEEYKDWVESFGIDFQICGNNLEKKMVLQILRKWLMFGDL